MGWFTGRRQGEDAGCAVPGALEQAGIARLGWREGACAACDAALAGCGGATTHRLFCIVGCRAATSRHSQSVALHPA
jgi:hypothetical protein